MNKRKEMLCRKVNTCTRGVSHRNTVKYDSANPSTKMKSKRHGLDYTPMFHFLLRSVGKKWDDVYRNIRPRIHETSPIFYMVAMNIDSSFKYFRYGESSFWSGMYIDNNGLLQITDKNMSNSSLTPNCSCCTHTFNGVKFTKKAN